MMTKGKFGLSLAAIAVIAFGFAALRQPQSVLLVVGFAPLAEKDEWLNRQAMQALLLTIVYYLAELVTGWIFGGLTRFFGWMELYSAAGAMGKVGSFVGDVLYLALIVFSVLAVLRVLRGKDADCLLSQKWRAETLRRRSNPRLERRHPRRRFPLYRPRRSGCNMRRSSHRLRSRRPLPRCRPRPRQLPGFCSACSAPLHEYSGFCTECGAKTE